MTMGQIASSVNYTLKSVGNVCPLTDMDAMLGYKFAGTVSM
jgi:hypothetical protein